MHLTTDLPNAMMLNVMGFNGRIPEQFQLHGQNMPWLGGWQYAAYALLVSLLIPLTACYSALIPRQTRLSKGLTQLFVALPICLGCMAIFCSVLNMLSWDAWHRFVANGDPLVYHGIVIHHTSPIRPCLSFALGLMIITWLQCVPTIAKWMRNNWTLPITLTALASLAVTLTIIGQAVTGRHPAILNRTGGYHSAWFLIMAMGIWLSVYLATRLMTIRHGCSNGSIHWVGRLAVGSICLLLSGWLIHLGLAFTDMGDTRFAAMVFHRAVGLGTWIQLAAAVCLVIVAIMWYRRLESHFLQQS